jgi:chorismate synthase
MGLRFLTAGESHGPGMLAILEGMPAGLDLSVEAINRDLKRRQTGAGSGERMKIEKDAVKILSGVMQGKTNGAPIGLFIENRDHANWRGRAVKPYTIPRPGHTDLSGVIKYGFSDLRPVLERASARETAARVAVGAVCRQLLAQFQIRIGGYISSIGPVTASLDEIPLLERIEKAAESIVRCPDPEGSAAMMQHIEQVIAAGDTAGGVIEVIALNLPAGLGSHVHWDRKLEAQLGAAVLGIQAMKGVEIGPAFDNAQKTGTQVQDPILLEGKKLVRPTNNSGGLEGGITNGQPLVVRAAMKPIATTIAPQPSVDLATGKPVPIQYERSDYTPVIRAVGVVEAMVAFVLASALLDKLGGDSMDEIRPRYENLRKMELDENLMEARDHIWWPE